MSCCYFRFSDEPQLKMGTWHYAAQDDFLSRHEGRSPRQDFALIVGIGQNQLPEIDPNRPRNSYQQR